MTRLSTRARTVASYYRSSAVRERIREYCGLADARGSRCVFLCGLFPGESTIADWGSAPRRPVADLDHLMETGADISRSLWETAGLLVDLDLDYMNVDSPAEAFTHPVETFSKLETAYRATSSILRSLSFPFLAVMTGEGYHFVARISAEHAAFDDLAALAPEMPSWWLEQEARLPTWMCERVSERAARAYTGLGMVLEYVGHEILRRSGTSPIPVLLNGTPVGTGLVGRECVSIDLSAAGDPLDVRHARVAFGTYQKHRFRPDLVGPRVSSEVQPLVAIPRTEGESWLTILERGRGTEEAIALAAARAAAPPEAGDGMRRLVSAYHRDPLARFHREFHSVREDAPERWQTTYGRLDLSSLPPCVGACLENPNDLLLKPGHLQNLVRTLLARGWHPRHVAGLVHSRYAADFGWGTQWRQMHAQTHADFYVRVFAGMIHTGVDRMIDFNCTSTREKGMCPGGCGRDLRQDRDRLLEAGAR